MKITKCTHQSVHHKTCRDCTIGDFRHSSYTLFLKLIIYTKYIDLTCKCKHNDGCCWKESKEKRERERKREREGREKERERDVCVRERAKRERE